jgi:hypothetical protein
MRTGGDPPLGACPYCLTIGRFAFSFQERLYRHCPVCDLYFAERRTDDKALMAYYQEGYFEDSTGDQLSGQRSAIYRQLLDLLEGCRSKGCPAGHRLWLWLLSSGRARPGLVGPGVDPSTESVAHARTLLGGDVLCVPGCPSCGPALRGRHADQCPGSSGRCPQGNLSGCGT